RAGDAVEGKESAVVLKSHRLIVDAADLPPVRSPLPIVRKGFIRYHKRRVEKQKEFGEVGRESIEVIRQGKRWWWMTRQYPCHWSDLDRVKKKAPFGMEIMEAFWGMERIAFMKYLDGEEVREERREEKIKEIRRDFSIDENESGETIVVGNVGRRNLRSFLLNRDSLLFRVDSIVKDTQIMTTSALKDAFLSQLRHFNGGLTT
ncbi:hypothetical protein PFISCL1PPCAC_10397, partial [Pristionchus fissidentatus]